MYYPIITLEAPETTRAPHACESLTLAAGRLFIITLDDPPVITDVWLGQPKPFPCGNELSPLRYANLFSMITLVDPIPHFPGAHGECGDNGSVVLAAGCPTHYPLIRPCSGTTNPPVVVLYAEEISFRVFRIEMIC